MMINTIKKFLVALPILVSVMPVDARVFHSKSKEREQQAVIQSQFVALEKQIHELKEKVSQLQSSVVSLSEVKNISLNTSKEAKKELSSSGAAIAREKLGASSVSAVKKELRTSTAETAKVDEIDLMSKRLAEGSVSEKSVFKNKDLTEKVVAVNKTLEDSADSESGLYSKIISLIERKDYNKAEKFAHKYMQVFSKEENSSAVLFWLGEIRMLFGDLVEAKSFYKKALGQLKGKGRTPEILLKISVISYKKGEVAEGDHYYNHLQKIYPGSTASHMARAQRKKYRVESE